MRNYVNLVAVVLAFAVAMAVLNHPVAFLASTAVGLFMAVMPVPSEPWESWGLDDEIDESEKD